MKQFSLGCQCKGAPCSMRERGDTWLPLNYICMAACHSDMLDGDHSFPIYWNMKGTRASNDVVKCRERVQERKVEARASAVNSYLSSLQTWIWESNAEYLSHYLHASILSDFSFTFAFELALVSRPAPSATVDGHVHRGRNRSCECQLCSDSLTAARASCQ